MIEMDGKALMDWLNERIEWAEKDIRRDRALGVVNAQQAFAGGKVQALYELRNKLEELMREETDGAVESH